MKTSKSATDVETVFIAPSLPVVPYRIEKWSLQRLVRIRQVDNDMCTTSPQSLKAIHKVNFNFSKP